MLFNYIYLLKNSDQIFDCQQEGSYEFIIPLTLHSITNKAKLFQQLYNTDHHFCFTLTREITGSDSISREELVRFLVTLFFLPNYLRYKGKRLLLLDYGFERISGVNALKDELSKQLNELVVNVLNDEFFPETFSQEKQACISNTELNNYVQAHEIGVNFERLINRIVLPQYLDKKWVVPVESKENFQHIIKKIDHFEKWILSTEPLLSSLIALNNNKEESRLSLALEDDILKIRLQNLNENLVVLRDNALWYVHEHGRLTTALENIKKNGDSDLHLSGNELKDKIESLQSDRDNILEWYKKEYEVLPKWYKRFGHVIKVAMGREHLNHFLNNPG